MKTPMKPAPKTTSMPHPDSIAVGNKGPFPDSHGQPLTPEQEVEKEKILAQMHDPSSPFGHIGIALGLSMKKPQD